MRPSPDYAARTLRFPDDRVVGDVRFVGEDGRPEDPIPAQGAVEVPAGKAAAFFGNPERVDLADATGLSHLFLNGEIDREWADLLATFPYLRQIKTGTRGLTADGMEKLLSAPVLARVDLNVVDEDEGGAAIVAAVAAVDDVEVSLTLGPAAVPKVCELVSSGAVSDSVTIDVAGAEERDLLPLRKLLPDSELNGIRYSPKALARLEASLPS
jgi:hypothetical protein